jgi:hypothetical protein
LIIYHARFPADQQSARPISGCSQKARFDHNRISEDEVQATWQRQRQVACNYSITEVDLPEDSFEAWHHSCPWLLEEYLGHPSAFAHLFQPVLSHPFPGRHPLLSAATYPHRP